MKCLPASGVQWEPRSLHTADWAQTSWLFPRQSVPEPPGPNGGIVGRVSQWRPTGELCCFNLEPWHSTTDWCGTMIPGETRELATKSRVIFDESQASEAFWIFVCTVRLFNCVCNFSLTFQFGATTNTKNQLINLPISWLIGQIYIFKWTKADSKENIVQRAAEIQTGRCPLAITYSEYSTWQQQHSDDLCIQWRNTSNDGAQMLAHMDHKSDTAPESETKRNANAWHMRGGTTALGLNGTLNPEWTSVELTAHSRGFKGKHKRAE